MKRIVVSALTLLLLGLLLWSFLAEVTDLRTRVILAVGSFLGLVYAVRGELPLWLSRQFGESLTADDDPRNISTLVYLPKLGCVLLVAIAAVWISLSIM